jgi:uncharacterized protein YbcI
MAMHDEPPARKASGAELARAGEGVAADSQGALRTAVANAMVGMKKQFYGRGPTGAKTYLADDYVFVVLDEGLTRNEETLLDAGRADLVRSYRLAFQEAMTATVTGAVEELVGRRVMSYHSQIVFNPTRTFEIFVLEPAAD